jgi:regulator of RNase E activity RraA
MAFVVGVRPEPTSETIGAVEAFGSLSTGSLGHLTDFGFAQGLQPLMRPAKAVGLAYTVRIPHLDGVAVHYALSHIERGEVLVIDTTGQRNRASWGGVTAYAASVAGVVAVIVDGPVTDWEEITESGPPVWCHAGTCSITGRKMGLEGAVEIPIQVGGAVVHPGDIVFADSDGVFFIRPDGAADLARTVAAREAREPGLKRRLDGGERMAEISGAAELAERLIGNGS